MASDLKVTATIPATESYAEKYGFHDDVKPVIKPQKGLNPDVVRAISHYKNEPAWMTDFRLKALDVFRKKPMPTGFWGGNIQNYQLDFEDIYYYLKPTESQGRTWDEVPEKIKRTFDRLGIPEAEKKFLAGVGAQYESEVIYHNLQEQWAKQGVIFLDTDS
ncbi:MAG: Fe-S cluster assembly protein SufB, partial [Verrucomicrobia bacterium]|nr:Fe-S cluster assembly protein SufB [Verrucomicrobiota bacterium]